MQKPYVICHMMSSVDGRIISENWGEHLKQFSGIYEHCHERFNGDAWMVGRVTMEKDFTGGEKPDLHAITTPIERVAFVANPQATSFAIAVDPQGKLGWTKNEIDGDHIIEILTETVSDEYIAYLKGQGISFVFAGKVKIDFKSALKQLGELFSIKTLMLEGGGNINGSMLNAGLIDELSLLMIPLADGAPNTATTFDVSELLPKKKASLLKLSAAEKLERDVLWLRYTFSAG